MLTIQTTTMLFILIFLPANRTQTQQMQEQAQQMQEQAQQKQDQKQNELMDKLDRILKCMEKNGFPDLEQDLHDSNRKLLFSKP